MLVYEVPDIKGIDTYVLDVVVTCSKFIELLLSSEGRKTVGNIKCHKKRMQILHRNVS